jgi:hypothetical protein
MYKNLFSLESFALRIHNNSTSMVTVLQITAVAQCPETLWFFRMGSSKMSFHRGYGVIFL